VCADKLTFKGLYLIFKDILEVASLAIIDMNKKITIRELSAQELELLLRDDQFNRLRPISCSECENKSNFSRKVFEVKGKSLASDEEARNLACYHVKNTYHYEHVIWKTL